jgi:hypothetical protein
MKTISRQEAKSLILDNKVISSYVDQDEHKMRVAFDLSNNRTCSVIYDLANHEKSYVIHDT